MGAFFVRLAQLRFTCRKNKQDPEEGKNEGRKENLHMISLHPHPQGFNGKGNN